VLGEQFAGDRELAAELAGLVEQSPRQLGPILALCEVDPENPCLMGVEFGGGEQENWLLHPAKVFLACAREPGEILLPLVRRFLSGLRGEVEEFPRECALAIARRQRRDPDFRAAALNCLTDAAVILSANEKAGLARILALAGGERETLLRWCEAELRRCELVVGYPAVALDPVEETMRPLSHVLLDLLVPMQG
jgi:hypothetical protein